MSQPNIIYLHSHDTGRYVQPYGHAVATPAIQKLAEGGVLFRNAHCAAPTCSPSRAALLTGESPHSCGMLGLAHRGFAMSHYGHHIAHTLAGAGYLTVLAGVQHIAAKPYADPAAMGYARMINHADDGHAHAALTHEKALEFLRSAPSQPFFLDIGFSETHRIGGGPGVVARGTFMDPDTATGDPRYVRPPAPLPDTPMVRQDMADFIASAAALDRKIGLILDELDRRGLAGNTLVINTTDHGIAFPAMKGNLTAHGTGVSLIMRGPGGFVGGRVSDALISQIDLFPTICDLLGIARPAWLEGKSILPILRGQAAEVNDEVFAELTFHSAYEPKRSVRTRKWNYIRRFAPGDRLMTANTDDGLSKSEWALAGWADRPEPREELFDLTFDPNEACNRAADPACKPILNEMRARLDAWMQRTNDPLLAGEVPLPPGCRVSPAGAYSPGGKATVQDALAAMPRDS